MKRISIFPGAFPKSHSNLAFLIFLSVVSLSGCVGLERSRSSGYSHRDQEREQGVSRDRKDFERDGAISELGINSGESLSSRDTELLENRIELSKAEKHLEGKREREQYFKNKPYMKNDRDRLDFLARDGFDSRQRWLNGKGINPTSSQHSPEIQYLVDTNDITLGMTKQAVRDSWGEPEGVEVSGNPIYGNERWHYNEQTSSTEGYQSQNRYVVFESGRVVGWESR